MSSMLFFFSVPACSPGALAKVKLPRSRPTSSSGKKGKRAAWAKETETQPLGDKCRDSKASTEVRPGLSMNHIAIHCHILPFVSFVSCKMFLVPQRFVEYNEFEEEDSPEDRAAGAGAASKKKQSCHCLDVISVQCHDQFYHSLIEERHLPLYQCTAFCRRIGASKVRDHQTHLQEEAPESPKSDDDSSSDSSSSSSSSAAGTFSYTFSDAEMQQKRMLCWKDNILVSPAAKPFA